MTPYRVSEIFLSIQGEGPHAGSPAHFLRLQGCDVGCTWCDTRYSWDPAAGETLEIDEAWRRAGELGESRLLVVTGGEPLQHEGLAELLGAALQRWPVVEVETSGVAPPPLAHERLHWNVSPKLPSVTPRWRDTWAHAGAWRDTPNATFKIVVGSDADAADAVRLIGENAIPADRVMLMPEGLTDEQVRAHAELVADTCKAHGYRMSPRLHIWMWGPKRGV